MKATIMIKELQHIVETEGDLDVDISVARQPEDEAAEQQQYLVANARFVIIEPYEKEKEPYGIEKRISIRDWPY